MAWARATIQIKPASIGTGIKVSLKRTDKSAARMLLSINTATAAELGWGDKDGIEVLIGEGEHHGLVRLRKNKSTGEGVLERREALKGAYYALRLGHQPAFVDRSEPALWCQWEKVEEGWVEIVLPKWADETGPKARKAAVVTREHQNDPPDQRTGPKAVEAQPIRQMPAKQNVTAAMMGDPPPGRREMLAKIGDMKL